jgi:transcriptional regulator with XRE-family HTH domain
MQLACLPFRKGGVVPRPNRGRTLASEANLARRIARERDRRDLSYEALAQAMTEQGCAIQGSAIYKIEKGNPPRRVTVDELVALAKVFDLPIDDILKPMELIEKERAEELITELNETLDLFSSLVFRTYAAYLQCIALEIENPELAEFVDRQHEFYVSRTDVEVMNDDPEVGKWMEDDFREFLLPLAQAFMQGLVKVADRRAQIVLRDDENGSADGEH